MVTSATKGFLGFNAALLPGAGLLGPGATRRLRAG
jgi:hypothetical protein